jgi:hypothetical protein
MTMALPTSYLTSTRNLEAILNALQSAQAPEKFNQSFLESLEFKSSSDRLIIGVLKALGFLDDSGKPTERYFRFLDQSQSARVLAEGVREAYQDLFRVNVKAYELSRQEVINKLKTLSQGQLTEAVLDKMASTFTALIKLADFAAPPAPATTKEEPERREEIESDDALRKASAVKLSGLVYNIQIVLPESRDTAVYEALFQALRKHIL